MYVELVWDWGPDGHGKSCHRDPARQEVTEAREVCVHRPSNSSAGIGVKATARLARARVLSYFRGGVRSPPIRAAASVSTAKELVQ